MSDNALSFSPTKWSIIGAAFSNGHENQVKGWWWRVESCEGSKLVLRVHEPTSKRERP